MNKFKDFQKKFKNAYIKEFNKVENRHNELIIQKCRLELKIEHLQNQLRQLENEISISNDEIETARIRISESVADSKVESRVKVLFTNWRKNNSYI